MAQQSCGYLRQSCGLRPLRCCRSSIRALGARAQENSIDRDINAAVYLGSTMYSSALEIADFIVIASIFWVWHNSTQWQTLTRVGTPGDNGVSSSASISTTVSKTAPSSVGKVFQYSTALSQSSPSVRTRGLRRSHKCIWSGATMPARACLMDISCNSHACFHGHLANRFTAVFDDDLGRRRCQSWQ